MSARASWEEVQRLRDEAEDYARKNDMLAAAMLDTQASRMAEALRKSEREKEPT